MDDLELATTIEETLRSNGISVESISLDDAVSLTYLTAFPDVEPNRGEVGRVITSFLKHARDDEFESRTVEAAVLRSEGDIQVAWALEADWIRACNDYALDDEELSQRVLDNLCKGDDA